MKILNKNYKVVKIKSGYVTIPIIKQPKYFIGEVELNEYDVRNIQREVAVGNITHDIANELKIIDEAGNVFNFREDGVLTNSPLGYDTISRMVLDILKNKPNNFKKD